jgi:hypothetical protein
LGLIRAKSPPENDSFIKELRALPQGKVHSDESIKKPVFDQPSLRFVKSEDMESLFR